MKTNIFANIDPNTPYQAQVPHPDKPQPIRYWQQKFEQHLYLIGRTRATQRRYARAMEKFLSRNKGKYYPHDFFRRTLTTTSRPALPKKRPSAQCGLKSLRSVHSGTSWKRWVRCS